MSKLVDDMRKSMLDKAAKGEAAYVAVPKIKNGKVLTSTDPNGKGHVVLKDHNSDAVVKYLEKIQEEAENSKIKNEEAALVTSLYKEFVKNGIIVPTKFGSYSFVPSASGLYVPAGSDAIVKSLFPQLLILEDRKVVEVEKISAGAPKIKAVSDDFVEAPYLFTFSSLAEAPKGKISPKGLMSMEFRKVSQESFDKFFEDQIARVQSNVYSQKDVEGKLKQLGYLRAILEERLPLFGTRNPNEQQQTMNVLFGLIADLYQVSFDIDVPKTQKELERLTVVVSGNAELSQRTNLREGNSVLTIVGADGQPLDNGSVIVTKTFRK